jgi:hypothetical protein
MVRRCVEQFQRNAKTAERGGESSLARASQSKNRVWLDEPPRGRREYRPQINRYRQFEASKDHARLSSSLHGRGNAVCRRSGKILRGSPEDCRQHVDCFSAVSSLNICHRSISKTVDCEHMTYVPCEHFNNEGGGSSFVPECCRTIKS